MLTGMLAAIALLGFNVLKGSMREAFRNAAMQAIGSITGAP